MEILLLSLSLSLSLSLYSSTDLSLCSSLRYPSIHPSTSPVSVLFLTRVVSSLFLHPPFSPPPSLSLSLSLSLASSVSCSFSAGAALLSLRNGETVSSRYSWGSRIARGLVTRLRTHLLLVRQLGPSVHQATILLISARIGSLAKCSQDYQFTMARGELHDAPPASKTMRNVAYARRRDDVPGRPSRLRRSHR